MKMVIVTLSCYVEGTEKSYDMEMPGQIAAKTLTAHICQIGRASCRERV